MMRFLRILKLVLYILGGSGIAVGVAVIRESGPGYDSDRAFIWLGACLFLIVAGLLISAYLWDKQRKSQLLQKYHSFDASASEANSQDRDETRVPQDGSVPLNHSKQILAQVQINDGMLVSSVGIETLGDTFTTLFEADTPVPCECRRVFSTASDAQKEIEIHILQGSSARASANTSLCKFKLTGLPRSRPHAPLIEVIFRIQPTGELVLMARNLEIGDNVHVVR